MARAYYVFEVKDAAGVAERHEISDEVVIVGRSQKRSQILVNDAKASGQHCELRFKSGKLTVHDMNSTNGTFVDGRRAQQPFPLSPNGSFKIGDSTLRLVAVFGADEEPMPKTQLGHIGSLDESTRALSLDDLEALRGAGLPPPVQEPPLAATQALDVESVPESRPGYMSPRRPDPSELRARQLAERQAAEAEARRQAEEARQRPSAPIAPDPRSLESRLKDVPADRTTAFDRADVEIGGYDHSWQPPQGTAEPEESNDWVSKSAKSGPASGAETRRSGPTGLVRTLAVVAALYAIAVGVFFSLRPGASADISIPEVDMSADPMLLATQSAVAGAQAARAMIDGEYRLAPLLGGEIYAIMDKHFIDLKGQLEALGDGQKRSPAETMEALTALTDKVGAVTATAGICSQKLEVVRRGLWYSSGAALATSATIIFGLAGVLGAFAGLGLVMAGALPLVLSQPAPYEPLFFTGVFAVLGLWIFALQLKNRRR